jgi:hypothetical protein
MIELLEGIIDCMLYIMCSVEGDLADLKAFQSLGCGCSHRTL